MSADSNIRNITNRINTSARNINNLINISNEKSNSTLNSSSNATFNSNSNTNLNATRITRTRIDGYSLNISTGGTNELTIDHIIPTIINKITFKPVEANIGDSFDLAWKSVEPIARLRMIVNPNITGITITISTSQLFELGWHIVISRNNINMILGDIVRIQYNDNNTVTLQIQRNNNYKDVPVIFQTEGINLINYNISLMSNISIVDTDPIVYENKTRGRYHESNILNYEIKQLISTGAITASSVENILYDLGDIIDNIDNRQLVLKYNLNDNTSKTFVFYVDLTVVV